MIYTISMNDMDVSEEDAEELKIRLLNLIEEGDATAILSSEYTESLNELIKCEFISIENDLLSLTDKGRQAKILGVKAVMEQQNPLEEKIEFSSISPQRNPSIIQNGSFLIILFFFLVSLLAIFTLFQST